ncbi:unnamed protein product [Penicillium nalgiovense]|uniref:CASTOR ACT domain-containing protein n=1 Tax=Penicillium nalgiovense TaxID=60175 RepID=A0A9W4HRK6_PENNA|nr:unnamed protein product [Penicillium nalgiovense]CAG8043614.1 unnamed protein product [Penicillium nalgiovense]CAG8064922.1 unnamed protein product [Penicillium nalgiovense]CAG8095430.1 unnamed protein product [Penicillium nalgiovense]CAG8100775.1 unnamed protein product [Penicillium nalgiovense]
MDQSMALIDAQVHFLECVVLVHIPLELYPYFLKSVLRLILDETPSLEDKTDDDVAFDDFENASEHGSAYKPPAFMNVSITPVEVSVMCPRRLVDKYFVPVMDQLDQLDASLRSRLIVSENDYIAMQVLGQGLEAGKRVLELTSPLALAGISIFFISTYFSDYIVVPKQSKASVISVLEKRGFQFNNASTAFITSPLSPTTERRLSDLIPPGTPPPSTLGELQTRTFNSLRKHQITPSVDDSLRLVQCAAHHEYHTQESSMSILRDALTTVLLVDEPRFLSLTLAALDPAASLLLEKRLLPRFARQSTSSTGTRFYEDGSGLLLGSKEDHLIPITLDLRDLPLEASGIVCGVAGRLADAAIVPHAHAHALTDSAIDSGASSVIGSVPGLFDSFGMRLAALSLDKSAHGLHPLPEMHHLKPDVDVADAVEISFLSTARAGTIIVGEDELRRAIGALEEEKRLEPGLEGVRLESRTPPDSPLQRG